MKPIVRIAKWGMFGSSLVVSAIFLAVFLTFALHVPQRALTVIVSHEMSKIFKQPVKVGRVSGNFLTGVQVQDIQFFNPPTMATGAMLEIKKADIRYSLSELLRHKGDILAATRVVTLSGVRLKVIRDKNDQWNIFSLLPPADPTAPPTPLSFKGLLQIVDMHMAYVDEKGWSQAPLKIPFSDLFSPLSGGIDFADITKAKIQLEGQLASNRSPLQITGSLNVNTGQFRLFAKLNNFNFKRWHPYILPFRHFRLNGDTIDLHVYLRSKYFPTPGTLPFFFDITTDLQEMTLTLPIFSVPVQHLTGRFRLTNSAVSAKEVATKLGIPDATEILTFLKKNNIIDHKYRVDSTIASTKTPLTPLILPKKWEKYRKKLTPLLVAPDILLIGETVSGTLANIPLTGTLSLIINKGDIALQLKTKTFSASALSDLFPALTSWELGGTPSGTVYVSGNLDNPYVSGEMQSSKLIIKNIVLKTPVITYTYNKEGLWLKLISGTVYGAPATGWVHTVFSPAGPRYNGEMQLENLEVGTNGFGLSFASGKASGTAVFSGDKTTVQITYTVPTANITLFHQNISAATGQMTVSVSPVIYDIVEGWLYTNGSKIPLPMSATLQPGKQWRVALNGETPIYDFIAKKSAGNIRINASISAQWPTKNKTIWESLSGQITASGTKLSLLGMRYDTGELSATIENGKTTVHQLHLQKNSSKLSFSGSLKQTQIQTGELTLSHYPIDTKTFPKKWIPKKFDTASGFINGKIRLYNVPATDKQHNANTPNSRIDFQGSLDSVQLQNQPISQIQLSGTWTPEKTTLSEIKIRQNKSIIHAHAIVHPNKIFALSILPTTKIQASDFQPLLYPHVGPLQGVFQLHGKIAGTFPKPDADIHLAIDNLQSYALNIAHVSGNITLTDGKLQIPKGYIQEGGGRVGFVGQMQLWNKTGHDRYAWTIAFQNTPMTMIATLIEALRREVGFRELAESPGLRIQEKITQSNATLAIPFLIKDPHLDTSGNKILYQAGGRSSANFYENVQTLYQRTQIAPELGLKRFLGGVLSGHVEISASETAVPNLNAELSIAEAILGPLRTTVLKLSTKTHPSHIVLSIEAEAGDLGGNIFDKISLAGHLQQNGVLSIVKADIIAQNQRNQNIISGTIPLVALWDESKADMPMDLEMRWEGDDINVLAVFSPYFSRISNKGLIVLSITGPVSAPLVSAKSLVLKDATIYLNPTFTPVTSGLRIRDDSVITLKNNVLTVNPLILIWKGPDTRPLHSDTEKENQFDVTGTTHIEGLSFKSMESMYLSVDLAAKNTDIAVNLNKIYQGTLRLENIKFKGKYELPISTIAKSDFLQRQGTEGETGPLLSGDIYLSRGILSLPTIGEKPKKPSILFGLSAHIKDQVLIDGSLLGEGFLGSVTNKFHLELAESIQPLRVNGSFNALKIQNTIVLKAGYVLMVNRSFDLISPDQQRPYYRDAQYKIHDNTVSFQTQFTSGRARLVPQFHVTAATIIEPKQALLSNASANTSTNPDDSKYTHMLVTLNGSAYNLQNFLFERYAANRADTVDTVEYRTSYRLSGGTNQGDTLSLLRILAPQVFEVFGEEQQSKDTFWQDVGSSQVNLIFNSALRPIETELARNVGLNDIRFEYNVGQAMFNNFSDKAFGINFVKSLFSDQLFVRVKTNVDLERKSQTDALQLSELELTYFFEKYFSVNAANLRKENGLYRNRYSAKYSNEF